MSTLHLLWWSSPLYLFISLFTLACSHSLTPPFLPLFSSLLPSFLFFTPPLHSPPLLCLFSLFHYLLLATSSSVLSILHSLPTHSSLPSSSLLSPFSLLHSSSFLSLFSLLHPSSSLPSVTFCKPPPPPPCKAAFCWVWSGGVLKAAANVPILDSHALAFFHFTLSQSCYFLYSLFIVCLFHSYVHWTFFLIPLLYFTVSHLPCHSFSYFVFSLCFLLSVLLYHSFLSPCLCFLSF